MNNFVSASILVIAFLFSSSAAQSSTFFQAVAGRWQGTLEYQDYSSNKRVTMRTIITIEPSADGNSAKISTIYDDFGKIHRSTGELRIDTAAGRFLDDKTDFTIESAEDGKIVLIGKTQDGNTVEPTRKTITFSKDGLTILKETRTPWAFRNVYTLTRQAENKEPQVTLSPKQLREDTAILKRSLTTLHPGVYRYNTPEQLEKEFTQLESKLNRVMSEGEYFILVSQLLSKLKCGHTYTNFYNQDEKLRNRLFGGPTYFPFYFQIVDGRMIITANASSKQLPLGSEITKINGTAVKQIIEKLLTVTRADGTSTLEHRIDSIGLSRNEAERFALFDWFYPLFFPIKDEVLNIEAVDFATRKSTTFGVLAMTKQERTAEMAKRYGPTPTYDDGWKFEIRPDGIGYLKIENSITWRLKTVKFKEFLANAFAELRAKNTKDLIIDLRGNGGGDMDPGFELSRYLAQAKLSPYAEGLRLVRNVAPQADLAKHITTYDNQLLASLKGGVPSALYRKFDDNFFQILGREDYPSVEPYSDRFTGRTFIIADSSNASATFQFLNYAQENRLATIVGQSTGGNKQGINGGNYLFLTLPNSKIEIDIPVYFQSPLKPQTDQSVVPEVYVRREPWDIGNRFDREIATVTEFIGKRDR